MFEWFNNRRRARRNAIPLYDSIVAQARQPAFYGLYGVADSVSGRFELIVLHLFIVLERLRMPEEEQEELSKALVETFVQTMDHEMREMGVGDLSVPKKVQKAAKGFYGRLQSYSGAVRCDDNARLPTALVRNVYDADVERSKDAERLANYVRVSLRVIGSQNMNELIASGGSFPDPAAMHAGASDG